MHKKRDSRKAEGNGERRDRKGTGWRYSHRNKSKFSLLNAFAPLFHQLQKSKFIGVPDNLNRASYIERVKQISSPLGFLKIFHQQLKIITKILHAYCMFAIFVSTLND